MAERPEEDGVVRAAGRGDRSALDLLVARHYEAVWRALVKFTGDRDRAESLTQEAFLKAIRSLRDFRGESAFRTWLIRIGLNLALNEARRRTPGPLPPEDPPAPAPGPAETALLEELRATVTGAVRSLPDDLREALLLTFYGGCSHAEAGRLLGCAEGTVSWRVFTAKQKLRGMLPDGL